MSQWTLEGDRVHQSFGLPESWVVYAADGTLLDHGDGFWRYGEPLPDE